MVARASLVVSGRLVTALPGRQVAAVWVVVPLVGLSLFTQWSFRLPLCAPKQRDHAIYRVCAGSGPLSISAAIMNCRRRCRCRLIRRCSRQKWG